MVPARWTFARWAPPNSRHHGLPAGPVPPECVEKIVEPVAVKASSCVRRRRVDRAQPPRSAARDHPCRRTADGDHPSGTACPQSSQRLPCRCASTTSSCGWATRGAVYELCGVRSSRTPAEIGRTACATASRVLEQGRIRAGGRRRAALAPGRGAPPPRRRREGDHLLDAPDVDHTLIRRPRQRTPDLTQPPPAGQQAGWRASSTIAHVQWSRAPLRGCSGWARSLLGYSPARCARRCCSGSRAHR